MKMTELIRTTARYKGVTLQALSEKTGKPYNTLRNILYKDNMNTDTLVEIADALGCDVVLIDRKTRKQFRP